MTVQELLKFATKKICAKMISILMSHYDSLCLFDSFIGLRFIKESILPRAWYTLLKNNEINEHELANLYKVQWQNEAFIKKSEVHKNLFECLAQIAVSHKDSLPQKKQMVM